MSLRRKIARARKVFFDPRWWPFRLQRLVTHPARRQRVADRLASLRPACAIPAEDLSDAGTVLKTDGQIHLPFLLEREKCEKLVAYFSGKPVTDPYRSHLGAFLPHSSSRSPETHVAYHDERDVVMAPGLLEFANRPAVLGRIAAFLGCKPTLSYLAVWWSFGTDGEAQQAEMFHRDVDDWAFAKLFVYLTDVDDQTGPHTYVKGSAASDKLTELRRFSDEEVIGAFGQDAIVALTGPAGTGLIENTFGIHRGMPVRNGTRLMFQAVYSLFPLFYAPRRPLARLSERPEWAALDPWINRAFAR